MSKKEYPANIGFWKTKSGKGYTAVINEKTRAELLRLVEEAQVGRRLYLGETNSDNEKAPNMKISVLPEQEKTAEGGF